MGKGKIKHETKREKMDSHRGGTQEEKESKVLPEDNQGGESKVNVDKIKDHW